MTSFRPPTPPAAVTFPPEELPAVAVVVVPTALTLVAPAREAGGTGHVGSIAAVAESEEPPTAGLLGDSKGGWVGVVGGCKTLFSFSNCALSFISEAIMAEIACSWSAVPPSDGAGGGGGGGAPWSLGAGLGCAGDGVIGCGVVGSCT